MTVYNKHCYILHRATVHRAIYLNLWLWFYMCSMVLGRLLSKGWKHSLLILNSRRMAECTKVYSFPVDKTRDRLIWVDCEARILLVNAMIALISNYHVYYAELFQTVITSESYLRLSMQYALLGSFRPVRCSVRLWRMHHNKCENICVANILGVKICQHSSILCWLLQKTLSW